MNINQLAVSLAIQVLDATKAEYRVLGRDGRNYYSAPEGTRRSMRRPPRDVVSFAASGYIDEIKDLVYGRSVRLAVPEGADYRRFANAVKCAARRHLGLGRFTVAVTETCVTVTSWVAA